MDARSVSKIIAGQSLDQWLMSSLDDKNVILIIMIVSDDQSCHSHAPVNTHHFSISPPDIHHFFISLCDHHFVVRHAAILTISSTQPLAQLPHFFFLYAIIALEITNSRCSTILQTSSDLHHNIHHYYSVWKV